MLKIDFEKRTVKYNNWNELYYETSCVPIYPLGYIGSEGVSLLSYLKNYKDLVELAQEDEEYYEFYKKLKEEYNKRKITIITEDPAGNNRKFVLLSEKDMKDLQDMLNRFFEGENI